MQTSKIFLFMPRWVEIGLVVFAAWLVSGLWVNSSHVNSVTFMQESEDVAQVTQQVDIKLLQQTPLFGQAPSKSPLIQDKPKDAPVVASRLNIKLIGTVVAGKKSAAMVSVQSSRKQEIFFLHEEIQPNVTLEDVEPTEIVVSNHGKRERISIEAGKPITQAPRAAAPKRRKAPQVSMQNIVNRKIDRNKLNSQMRNFSTLLSQARVSPHFTNKKPDGFTISEIVKGSLYEEIGLKNGDVIKKVNGESVTGAEQAMRMYRELQSATFIDVEVERAGTLQQISYVIQ